MNNTFIRYKWINLITFSLMYNFVYLGRFNVNNLITYIAKDISLSASHQEMISISVFVSYAVGSFINGYLADKFGSKRIVVLGGVMTSFLNLCVPIQENWITLLVTWFLNGYFQSMIWVGGVSLLANWWKGGERGKGIGIANFFSGMSHTTAYLIPLMILSLWPSFGWKLNFVIPISILLVFVILFAIFAKEAPEDVGEKPYDVDIKRYKRREKTLEEIKARNEIPWKYFFKQKHFMWWCGIAALSSICRYGLLNWIPLYFSEKNGVTVISDTFSNLTLPIGMAFGTLIITWLAGTNLFNNKGIIVTALSAMCGTLIIVFPMINNTQSVLVGIFFTGFALYGINGILWVHAIDQGCRVFAGSVAGIFNGFAYLGASLEGILFPTVVRTFGNYLSIFVVMELLCICMVVCGMVVSKKNTSIVPEVRE